MECNSNFNQEIDLTKVKEEKKGLRLLNRTQKNNNKIDRIDRIGVKLILLNVIN